MSELRWERAVAVHALREVGGILGHVVDGLEIAIYAIEDGVFATSDLCTHGAARLSQGYLLGKLVECPMHQGLFDVRTGAAAGPPCTRAVQTFPVRVEEDVVWLGLPVRATTSDEGPK